MGYLRVLNDRYHMRQLHQYFSWLKSTGFIMQFLINCGKWLRWWFGDESDTESLLERNDWPNVLEAWNVICTNLWANYTHCTNSTMYQSRIPQCSIFLSQNGALWDIWCTLGFLWWVYLLAQISKASMRTAFRASHPLNITSCNYSCFIRRFETTVEVTACTIDRILQETV